MPASLASLRVKLTNKIFTPIGTSVTINNLSTTTNKWGDETTSTVSSSVVTAVPYDMVGTEEFLPFADLQVGELAMVLPYSASFNANDLLVYGGSNYLIKETVTYPYQGGVLAYAVRLSKVL